MHSEVGRRGEREERKAPAGSVSWDGGLGNKKERRMRRTRCRKRNKSREGKQSNDGET